jgi:hypothetical protein
MEGIGFIGVGAPLIHKKMEKSRSNDEINSKNSDNLGERNQSIENLSIEDVMDKLYILGIQRDFCLVQ